MSRPHLTAATLCIAVLIVAGLVVHAGDQNKMSPEFNVDFVDGEEILVFGLTFGFGL